MTRRTRPPVLCEGCHRPATNHGEPARRRVCFNCSAKVGPCCTIKFGPGQIPLKCEECEERRFDGPMADPGPPESVESV